MPIDKAGRQIAGLLTYNPGPGIYSRLESAIQAMPENVRSQELPGLLKRYKDGVPGWELKATDLDSVIAGRDVVPREELLGAVRESSPVYTHKEVVLGGTPPRRPAAPDGSEGDYDVPVQVFQGRGSPLGGGVSHGEPKYQDYGQGGQDYSELLLLQPGAGNAEFGSHWTNANAPGAHNAVAHARYDTHGDALRINELQSDLGIHNRKAREYADQNPQIHFGERLNPPEAQGLPFPLEDAWSDLLIKRMALEAARKGHRAIEVASPRAIADKVGGNIDNYEHFYGKVVPGALERLGRKMGGLVDDAEAGVDHKILSLADAERSLNRRMGVAQEAQKLYIDALRDAIPGIDIPRAGNSEAYAAHISRPLNAVSSDAGWADYLRDRIATLHAVQTGRDAAEGIAFANSLMPQMMRKADEYRAGQAWDVATEQLYGELARRADSRSGRRYLMSDEMRRRLIQEGVGAAVAGGLMSQDDLIERLGQ